MNEYYFDYIDKVIEKLKDVKLEIEALHEDLMQRYMAFEDYHSDEAIRMDEYLCLLHSAAEDTQIHVEYLDPKETFGQDASYKYHIKCKKYQQTLR